MTISYNCIIVIMALPTDLTYTAHEAGIIEQWKRDDITALLSAKSESYTEICDLMDGPPFPSGELHPGHMAISSLKDVMARFFNMCGVRCRTKIGYDCHGLPVEVGVMSEHGLETSEDIIKFGIGNFCSACKERIKKVSGSWGPIFEKIGRNINLKDNYTTMDKKYMESVWWIFSELNKKGLVYEARKVMPVSYSCSTVLSNFEAGLNYKDTTTVTGYVAFKMEDHDAYLVAWTTTPWTLPSNIALCVNPDMVYVMCLCSNGKKYVVSEDSVSNLKLKIVSTEHFMKGHEMVGIKYEPLFTYLKFKYHRVIADSYVKKSDETLNCGTGIVHIAPAFGEDDCRICVEQGIINQKELSLVCPVDINGTFNKVVEKYAGMLVFDADEKILSDLTERGLIARKQVIVHKYPHCYRKDTKLIYMACPSFFVEVTKIKEELVERNNEINWTNEAIGSKRFRNWLEQAKDWSISRTRFFGTPLPVLVSEDGTDTKVFGSIAEITNFLNLDKEPDDIHNDWFNSIEYTDQQNGKKYRGTGFVFDCWFESGCVPFAQLHYPFENADYFSKGYQNFVIEGLDQTRGWFYTLLVIFTAVTPSDAVIKVPFNNVVCMGLILDENGEKFSKKLKNFVETDKLLNLYGADALRMYLIKSPLVNGEPLCFNEVHIKDLFAKIIPLFNAVKFYLDQNINANRTLFDGKFTTQYLDQSACKIVGITNIDLWILEKVAALGNSVKNDLKNFRLDVAARDIMSFIDILTNWYLKLNRDRMKGANGVEHLSASLSTMYTVLYDYLKITAPFMPFLTEYLYSYVVSPDVRLKSIHLENFPDRKINFDMTEKFNEVTKIIRHLRNVREKSGSHVSVKIPIKKCTIYYDEGNNIHLDDAMINIIKDEVNCLEIIFQKFTDDIYTYEVQPNWKNIGPAFKKDGAAIKKALQETPVDILKEQYGKEVQIINVNIGDKIVQVDGNYFKIITKINIDVTDKTKIIEDKNLLVNVDLTYDIDIHEIYQARKFISLIQNIRNERELKPWDKIKLYTTNTSENTQNLFAKYAHFFVKKLGSNIEILDNPSMSNPQSPAWSPYNFDDFTEGNKQYGNFKFCMVVC